jgi:hypothetical protein
MGILPDSLHFAAFTASVKGYFAVGEHESHRNDARSRVVLYANPTHPCTCKKSFDFFQGHFFCGHFSFFAPSNPNVSSRLFLGLFTPGYLSFAA